MSTENNIYSNIVIPNKYFSSVYIKHTEQDMKEMKNVRYGTICYVEEDNNIYVYNQNDWIKVIMNSNNENAINKTENEKKEKLIKKNVVKKKRREFTVL